MNMITGEIGATVIFTYNIYSENKTDLPTKLLKTCGGTMEHSLSIIHPSTTCVFSPRDKD